MVNFLKKKKPEVVHPSITFEVQEGNRVVVNIRGDIMANPEIFFRMLNMLNGGELFGVTMGAVAKYGVETGQEELATIIGMRMREATDEDDEPLIPSLMVSKYHIGNSMNQAEEE